MRCRMKDLRDVSLVLLAVSVMLLLDWATK
jgi:hypothetical protein